MMHRARGTTLLALRDIDGVLGGFLLDSEGGVVAEAVPRVFSESLAGAGEHLSRLREALELSGAPLAQCVARFGDHLLVMRTAGDQTLCVLCSRGTNLPALQMGCTLVMRRLENQEQSPRPARVETLHERDSARRFRGRTL